MAYTNENNTVTLFGSFVTKINHDALTCSFPQVARNALKRTNTKIRIKGIDEAVKTVLEKKAAVIVANHPYDADVLALIACLPDRQDIYLIINNRFTGFCPNLRRFLIPVYIDHHRNPRGSFKRRFVRMIHPISSYSPHEEHEKNIKNIKLASQKLQSGAIVIIFPGRRSVDGQWFSGVGHMIKNIGNEKELYIVGANILGASNVDYLRLLPFIGKFLGPLSVSFAKPMKMNEVWDTDAKVMTKKLEDIYNRWFNRLPLNQCKR